MGNREEEQKDIVAEDRRRRLHVEQTPLGVIDWDLHFQVVAWNPGAERIFGYTEQEAMGRHARDLLIPEEYKEHVDSIWRSLLEQSGGTRSTNGNVTKAQKDIQCEWYNTPLVDDNGETVGVASLVMDVTEREEALLSLNTRQARYRAAQKLANIANFDCELSSGKLHDAGQLLAMLDYDDVDESRCHRDFLLTRVHDSQRTRLGEILLGQLRPGEVIHFDFKLKDAQDKYRFFRLDAQVLDEEQWPTHHLLGFLQDITQQEKAAFERRNLEKQIQHTQKLESLGVLAGGIAHDFNNLLVAIVGNADLALLDVSRESPVYASLLDIKLASKRAAGLTNQMLAYAGRGQFLVERVSLNRVVSEMRQILEVSISKKVVLRDDINAELPLIEADASQLRQVVMNLITNASEAIGEESGLISMRTGVVRADESYLADCLLEQKPGWFVFLEVADTGCGMDAETQGKLFEPFFTTKFTGRGLGMAAVLGIIRQHQGTLRLYSEVDRGTTFRVLFPVDEGAIEEIEKSQVRQELALAGGQKIILLVDDEEAVRKTAQRLLERAGYNILCASDGDEAVEIYKASPKVDLVLLDLTMPHMGGEETFKALQKEDATVRVVLMSGYTELDVRSRFAGRNFNGFIQKPFEAKVLYEIVERSLVG